MDSSSEEMSNDNGNAGEVLESLGEPREAENEIDESHNSQGDQKSNDPLYVQRRLKQQKRAHEREIRELHSQLGDLQSQIAGRQSQDQASNPYSVEGQAPHGIDEQIHKAVSYALQHKEMEERKADEAQKAAHVRKQYGELQNHLDATSDKYDDFDEVVRGQDAPFTPHMRDAALMLPKTGPGSAGEVLYKLGKNPQKLKEISNLHPLDQASEMVKLSHSLILDGKEPKESHKTVMGQVKARPVTNAGEVTEKTPPSAIRARMKAGTWK